MKKILFIIIFTISALTQPALALEPVYTGFFSNVAIKGYDPVAYFTDNAARVGDESFNHEYMGATWHFVSAENRDLFAANPQRYAPQYGGYCAYAVSQNATASVQPDLFTIVDGKLYLNYNESVNDKWRANKVEFIELADKNWPTLLTE